jgi:serine/threonine-protein kinase
MNKYYPYILYLVVALLMVVLAANDFAPLNSLQRSMDDFLCSFTAPEGTRPNVYLVDIDGASLDKYGDWPWDHDLVADLTAAIAAGEPNSILLDLDLYEDADQEAAGHTNVLAEQLAWIRQVVLPYDIAETTFRSGKTRNPENLFNNSVAVDNPLGIMDERSSLQVRKVFLPAEKLLIDKPLLGFDYNRPDPDRLLRHQPLLMNFDGYYYPSNSLLAAATYFDIPPDQIKVVEGREIQIGSHRRVPINERGEIYLRFSDGVGFNRFSAAQVLAEEFDRSVFENKAIVLGQLRGNESEYFDTPGEENRPEMLIKATVIENIVNNNLLTVRNDLARLSLIVLLVLGGICAFALPRVNMMYRMVILGGGLIVLANVNYLLFSSYGMLVPTIYIALELILFMIASPLLDSALLAGSEAEEKAPKVKAKQAKVKEKAPEADVPVREIKAKDTDEENVKTTALGRADEHTSAVAEIDHQSISLDEPAPEETIAGPVADDSMPTPVDADQSDQLTDSDADLTSHLTDSDAALMSEDEEASDSRPVQTDTGGAPVTAADLKNLGRYQIQKILGKGAMGTVYLGVDPAINRPVALKTIRLDFVTDPDEMEELKERLHREAQSAGKLSHPNLVTIYDVGSEGSLQYIAMEYLEGQTLEDMIKKKTRFNYRIIAQMISQICGALEYAHEQGIVHRDIKPANIMVLGDYRAKVMDFGIARVDSSSMTKTGIAMGTPNYISPEQLKGLEIDRRADIFSLGVVMYEMLLGRRPFKGENLTSLMYAILNNEPDKPSSVRPQIPLLFDHIIGRALKKDPAERYQKASEITADLQDFVESFAH